ncbi:hypothetical protein [Rhizobium sophoriradicis]|uniref:hypothetical protein n=1 Tax=Rhizobium sophoriradicis TaxID=1535245 RepID=UPI003CC9C568
MASPPWRHDVSDAGVSRFLTLLHRDVGNLRRLQFRQRGRPDRSQGDEARMGLLTLEGWENGNAKFIRDRGGMVGKTTRVAKDSISKAVNPFCGYLVVEAETAEEVARLFENHPHITVFPGDGVDIFLS